MHLSPEPCADPAARRRRRAGALRRGCSLREASASSKESREEVLGCSAGSSARFCAPDFSPRGTSTGSPPIFSVDCPLFA
ncbi:hypothetical protein [Nesterenkonia pannonica]|uniref:hypothetical protein n=1 Tax=Nesterenkonia pannonica TaxID=1548602 RepID=UPI00216473E2|nr:hypothetical protein [Nesterenkonia pannonica]